MSWVTFIQVVILILLVTGGIVGAANAIIDIKRVNSNEKLMRVESAISERIVPALTKSQVEYTEKFMDILAEKIPDVMENTINLMKKMEEED